MVDSWGPVVVGGLAAQEESVNIPGLAETQGEYCTSVSTQRASHNLYNRRCL